MGRGEKILLIAVVLGGCTVGSFWLTGRSLAKARVLETMTGRLIFTSASYADPESPISAGVLLDGEPTTALPDLNAPARRTGTRSPIRAANSSIWAWSPDRAFVQLQVGLTHAPERPPRPNPLLAMRVWPGNQASAEDFRRTARPRTVRLIFFRQQIVDLDREYRLPEEPVFWKEKTVRLLDRMGPQRVALDFLDEPGASPAFPGEVQQIWLRLEISDYFPGNDPVSADAIALSELAFDFRDSY